MELGTKLTAATTDAAALVGTFVLTMQWNHFDLEPLHSTPSFFLAQQLAWKQRWQPSQIEILPGSISSPPLFPRFCRPCFAVRLLLQAAHWILWYTFREGFH